MRSKFQVAATLIGAIVSLMSALSMADHVRLVEIIGLFFGGMGTGAGLAALRASSGGPRPVTPPEAGG